MSTPNIGSHLDTTDANLVAYYPFEGNTSDMSSNSNNGIESGVNYTLAGRVGGAYSFDGISSYVKINDDASLDVSTASTFEFWIKPSDGQPTASKAILSKLALADRAYGIDLRTDGTIMASITNTANGWDAQRYTSTPLSNGQETWHHVAFTFDGSSLHAYLDGVLNA